jgi:hypothetical protein
MPIPPGVDPAYMWCLLWLGLEGFLLGVTTQLGSLDELRERVVARTYRRLPPLNDYLNRAQNEHWLSGEPIPDHAALVHLKREVDRAAFVDGLLARRLELLAGCRLSATMEIAAALCTAIAVAAGTDTSVLVWPCRVAFAVGTVLAVTALVWCQVVALRITKGDDME